MGTFAWPVRVYYEDTDAGGVVYHSNYLNFMERARSEYLRQFGFEQDRLIADFGILFAVRAIQIDYLRPARFNQMLRVEVGVKLLRPASVTFLQRVFDEATGLLLCEADVKIACIDYERFRSVPIPPTIRECFES